MAYPPVKFVWRSIESRTFTPRGTKMTKDGFIRNTLHLQPPVFADPIIKASAYVDPAKREQWKPEPLDLFRETMEAYTPLIQKLQQRGGTVALIGSPLTGRRLVQSELCYPRSPYWDLMGGTLGVDASVHFKDLHETSKLPCLDGLHLNSHDASTFTGELLEELRNQGFFNESD